MILDSALHVIPDMLWPPCAVLSLLGCALLMWKNRNPRTIFLVAVYGGMWLWRIAFCIDSSRYAAGMLPVAFGLAVYAPVKLMEEWPRLKFPLLAGFLVLIGIAAVKDFLRPESPYVMRTAEQLAELRHMGEPVYAPEKHAGRYGYYLHCRVEKDLTGEEGGFSLFQSAPGPLWVIRHVASDSPAADDPAAVLCARIPRGPRHEVRVYRYTPRPGNSEIPADAVNAFADSGLETGMAAAEAEPFLRRYRKRGYRFYDRPELTLPAEWYCWIPRPAQPETAPEFSLWSDNPVSGNSSLRICWRNGNQVCSRAFPRGRCRFAFSVKGTAGAAFSLWIHASDAEGKWVSEAPLAQLFLARDGVSRFQVEIPETAAADCPLFRIGFYAVNTELLLDDVVLVRIPDAKEAAE